MKNKILELINSGMGLEKVTEKVYENECMAMEFKEDFPSYCHEDADCFDCWKQRIIKISKNSPLKLCDINKDGVIYDVIHERLGTEGAKFKEIINELEIGNDECVLEVKVEYRNGDIDNKVLKIINIQSDDIGIIELQ
ncbi:MAG: hypothetical protein KH415_09570 [Clostridium sp.]|nr:hypothetical protein [Clostridium sp.]